jgi:hypothetical protein
MYIRANKYNDIKMMKRAITFTSLIMALDCLAMTFLPLLLLHFPWWLALLLVLPGAYLNFILFNKDLNFDISFRSWSTVVALMASVLPSIFIMHSYHGLILQYSFQLTGMHLSWLPYFMGLVFFLGNFVLLKSAFSTMNFKESMSNLVEGSWAKKALFFVLFLGLLGTAAAFVHGGNLFLTALNPGLVQVLLVGSAVAFVLGEMLFLYERIEQCGRFLTDMVRKNKKKVAVFMAAVLLNAFCNAALVYAFGWVGVLLAVTSFVTSTVSMLPEMKNCMDDPSSEDETPIGKKSHSKALFCILGLLNLLVCALGGFPVWAMIGVFIAMLAMDAKTADDAGGQVVRLARGSAVNMQDRRDVDLAAFKSELAIVSGPQGQEDFNGELPTRLWPLALTAE